LGFAPMPSEFVPRTNRETIVAAIDAIAHEGPQIARNRALVFDGEVGNAASRIEAIGRRKCRGRTNIKTRPTGPAAISLGRVGRQLQCGKERAEKQPGAEFARYQVGVLALPAQAGSGGQWLFHDGGSINKNPGVAARLSDEPAGQRLEPFLDHIVVIV